MNKYLATLLAFLSLGAHAADVAISGLPAAASVTASDEFPTSQAGTTRKATALQIEAYIEASLLASNLTWTGANIWSSAEPRLRLNETDQGADLKIWDLDVASGVFTLRTRTDADGAGVNAIAVTRGATTAISNVALGNATNNPTGNWLGTGTFTFGGQVLGAAGTNLLPSFSFSGDPNTGFYSSVADQIGITTGGVIRGSITTTAFNFNLMPVYVGGSGLNGTVTAPSLAWNNDTNTGWYRLAEDSIGMTVGGVLRTTYGTTETLMATNLSLGTIGNKISVKTGSNASVGTAVLSAGTVTVNNTLITANSQIQLTPQDGSANIGSVWVSAKTVGTSFVISSSNVLDTRTVFWQIIEIIP